MTSLPLLLAALSVLFTLVSAEPSRYKITFKNQMDFECRNFVKFVVFRLKAPGSASRISGMFAEEHIPANPENNNVLELEELDREGENLTQIMAFYSESDYIAVVRNEIVGFANSDDEVGLINLAYNQVIARNEANVQVSHVFAPHVGRAK